MYNTILYFLCVCKTCKKKIWCHYIIDCSCYSEENKNRHNFLCATAWITIVAKSDVWIAITFSLLMQMPRFTYHFNSLNLLFKAVPNLVQNIAFEKNIPVPTAKCPARGISCASSNTVLRNCLGRTNCSISNSFHRCFHDELQIPHTYFHALWPKHRN